MLTRGYFGKGGANVLHVGGSVAADCTRCGGMELACVRRGGQQHEGGVCLAIECTELQCGIKPNNGVRPA